MAALAPSVPRWDETGAFGTQPWGSRGGAGGVAGFRLSQCSCTHRNPQGRNALNAEENPALKLFSK